jgi:hypothetical protein
MHTQHAGDPQQRANPRVSVAGLEILEGFAAHLGGEEHALLGAVLAQSLDADAVADGAALLQEPGVVIGQGWHSLNMAPTMIISQPGKPGIP